MNKLAGVVILYKPETDMFKNLRSYLPFLDVLYVADNTEEKAKFPPDFPETNIHLIQDGENRGIAYRLNQAATLAKEKGYRWLLTMDQDSFFDQAQLTQYIDCLQRFDNSATVAMFGVEYNRKNAAAGCACEAVSYHITSGSLLNLDLFSTIGRFDENLFIDEVDLEYCYRANIAGYKVIKFNNIYLNHSLGTVRYHRSLKNFKLTPRALHSPVRVYYMIRNYLYVSKKYPGQFPEDRSYRLKTIRNRIKNNLLYGNQRLLLLKMIVKAFLDYRNNRWGKINLK